jgi:hypothetical protein
MIDHPFGPVLLFGSGETQPASGKAYERLNRLIGAPPCISILETPAGFQPNSDKVAGEVGDFLKKRLQNYQPRVEIIPARCKTQPFSTNDANLLEPMLRSNWIFMGPGSPTYAIRQLRDSLAYAYLRAPAHEWQRNLPGQRLGFGRQQAHSARLRDLQGG